MYFSCISVNNSNNDIITEVTEMPKTGEKPGAGQYTCKKCGKTLTLDDETDKLPPCSDCGGTEFK